MGKTGRQLRGPLGMVLAGSLFGATLAFAQDAGDGGGQGDGGGGLFGRIDLSAGLRSEVGRGPDQTEARARLSFGLDSVTRVQALRALVGGEILLDGDGVDLIRPSASLSYALTGKRIDLDAQAKLDEIDLDRRDAAEIDEDDEILSEDGTRRTLALSLGLVTGKDTRFGTDTRLSFSDSRYADTTDPDLADFVSRSVSTTLRFDLSPVLQLRLTAGLTRRETEDALLTDRRSTRLGFGATYALATDWTLSADIAASRIETVRGLGAARTASLTEGYDARLSATRALDDGSFTVEVAHQVTVAGDTLRFSIARAFEMKNGSLEGSLGAVRFDDGTVRQVASLAFARDLRRGQLTADLSQTASVNADDLATLRTRLSLGYRGQITETSSWSARLGLADIAVIGGAGDQRRYDFGVDYSRALTADWDMSVGLDHRQTYRDGVRDREETAVTLDIKRSFVFRP